MKSLLSFVALLSLLGCGDGEMLGADAADLSTFDASADDVAFDGDSSDLGAFIDSSVFDGELLDGGDDVLADATADDTEASDAGPDVDPDPGRAFSMRFRVSSFNVPETRRASLLTSREARANRVLNLLRDNNVSAASVQESGTYLQAAAASRDAWRSTWAPHNSFVNGRRIGNGIVFRRASLRLLDSHDLRVPMPGAPRGLNIPVRLFEYRSDSGERARFAMISFHAPTRRADPSDTTRRALRQTLLRYIQRCHRRGIPVVLAGDANDGAYAQHFRPALKVASHHVVDWILVSREIRVHGEFSRSAPLLSDHHAIMAAISVPVRAETPRQLPD